MYHNDRLTHHLYHGKELLLILFLRCPQHLIHLLAPMGDFIVGETPWIGGASGITQQISYPSRHAPWGSHSAHMAEAMWVRPFFRVAVYTVHPFTLSMSMPQEPKEFAGCFSYIIYDIMWNVSLIHNMKCICHVKHENFQSHWYSRFLSLTGNRLCLLLLFLGGIWCVFFGTPPPPFFGGAFGACFSGQL